MTTTSTPLVDGPPAVRPLRRVLTDPSAVLFVAQLVVAASAFLANVLSARALGPAGRGELALVLQIAYFGTLAVLLGCERSVVAVYQDSSPRTVTRAFVRLLLRPSAVIVVGAAAILALPVPGLENWRLRLSVAVAFMVVNAFNRAVRSIAIASGRVTQYLVYGVTAEVLLLSGLLLMVALGRTESAAWVSVYVVAGVLSGGGWLLWWSRPAAGPDGDAGPPADVDDRDRLRRARKEGLVLLPATVAHSGTLRLDRLILAGLVSTTALGLYAAVATIVELIAWPLLVFADSRLGVWRQAHDRGRLSLRPVLLLAVGYCLVAIAVMATALHHLVEPLLGPGFAAAKPLILPMAAAAALFGISQLLVNALTAVHRASSASLVELVGMAVSVVAYVVLIDAFGALGAAYGSLLGYAVCLVLAGVLLPRAMRRAPAPSLVGGNDGQEPR